MVTICAIFNHNKENGERERDYLFLTIILKFKCYILLITRLLHTNCFAEILVSLKVQHHIISPKRELILSISMCNRIIITYIVSSSSVDTSGAVKPQVKLKFLLTASVSGTLTLLIVSFWQLHIEIRNLKV